MDQDFNKFTKSKIFTAKNFCLQSLAFKRGFIEIRSVKREKEITTKLPFKTIDFFFLFISFIDVLLLIFLSCIVLKNGQTYFNNLVVFTP